MHSCMSFSTVELSIWQSTLIIFCLSAQPFSGSVGKAATIPLCVHTILERSAFRPLLCTFTRCIWTPWMFALSGFPVMSDMEFFSRDPLWSWGSFSLWMFLTFSEESPKWPANFFNCFRVSWHLCSVQSLWGYPLLPPSLQVSYRPTGGGSFWGIPIVPKFSLILGVFQSSRKNCFVIASNVPGSLVPAFCCYCLETNKVSTGRFPSFWRALKCICLSSFLWWGEDKNRDNRIIG